jgi:hypothetical protein
MFQNVVRPYNTESTNKNKIYSISSSFAIHIQEFKNLKKAKLLLRSYPNELGIIVEKTIGHKALLYNALDHSDMEAIFIIPIAG